MNTRRLRRSLLLCAVVLGVLAPVASAGDTAVAASTVDFDSHVRPILFSRCVGCHGAGDAEAGLRLDSADALVEQRRAGSDAIVPGDPERSELLQRVLSDDPDERMPPSGEPLTQRETEHLRNWIAGGASWPMHWAYRPLIQPQPPPIHLPQLASWVKSPVDAFIAQKLAEQQLLPTAAADRHVLLRRVYFDLLGLPPSPEAIEAFLQDSSPAAYERVVDELLASPHYGERWARHWMDLVHFAETHGHDQDRVREHAWPYRDYLIHAFNADKPYARFVQEQVAGDVLYPDDPWATPATGFLAAGPWDESSLRDIQADSIDRQIAQYLDRDDIVATTMTTFTSTTVHCARCHDHKFDPISQQEYYRLQAVFAGIDKANRPYDPDPQVAAQRRAISDQVARLTLQREQSDPAILSAAVQAEVEIWEQQLGTASAQWHVVEPSEFRTEHGTSLTKQSDYSLLATGERPEKDTYSIVIDSDLSQLTGIRLEVLCDEGLPQGGPGRQDNGNLHLSEFTATAELPPSSQPSGAAAEPVQFASAQADFDQLGWTAAHAIDGNPATAWGIHPQVGQSHKIVFTLQQPLVGPVRLSVQLQQLHGGGHLIGRLRLALTDSPAPLQPEQLPSEITEALAPPPSERSDAQRAQLGAWVIEKRLQQQLAALPEQALVYCGTNRFKPDGSFRPASAPRTVHMLRRGEIDQPLEEVRPAALSLMAALESDFDLQHAAEEGARRAALAHWLTDDRNVLLWRSVANRLWQFHFGRGIVDTPGDLGHMGSSPTHPELLDWLAAELRGRGGSLKSLHRQIVTSAVYRQASDYDSPQAEHDADNRYLWRMNRRRLDAESIRDAALQIAAVLDRRMGGPSDKQFIQSPGIHVTPVVDYQNFDAHDPAQHRRSVYRFLFRTLPDPLMESLDCPDGSQLTPQRSESVTPLHALSLLNDKLIVRLSEQIAERASVAFRSAKVASGSEVDGTAMPAERSTTFPRPQRDLQAQAAAAVRLILGREPRDEERIAIANYAAEHGLANACRFLLNTNEFIFVD